MGHILVNSPDGPPSFLQELFDKLFLLFSLLPPPPPEKGGLHVDEPPLPVLHQGGDHAVQDVLNSRPLDVIPGNNKTLSFFPSRRFGK